ncbi:unnamed protein product [Taenia asiatica]|uniref:Fibronectin type-III domain-containing protein n=1 Tax=Taenia asiatica TaxID=60517 RepID=A0A0R3VYI3_TAEAS|nr:unnamed protein product [Taenia asiatica]
MSNRGNSQERLKLKAVLHQTTPTQLPPEAPQNVTIKITNSRSVHVSWKPPSRHSEYVIDYVVSRSINGAPSTGALIPKWHTERTFNEAAEIKSASVTVCAYYGSGVQGGRRGNACSGKVTATTASKEEASLSSILCHEVDCRDLRYFRPV